MPTDTERMDWLDRPDRHISRREIDLVRSDPCVEKSVCFYIKGRYTVVSGKTARDAVDSAMEVYQRSHDDAQEP